MANSVALAARSDLERLDNCACVRSTSSLEGNGMVAATVLTDMNKLTSNKTVAALTTLEVNSVNDICIPDHFTVCNSTIGASGQVEASNSLRIIYQNCSGMLHFIWK